MELCVLSGNEHAIHQAPLATASVCLSELLTYINRKTGTQESMLHSVAARYLEYANSTAELVSIADMHDRKEPFIVHLKANKYIHASVKSYRNYLNILLRCAQELGWVRPHLVIPDAWQSIADTMPRSLAEKIVHYGTRIGKSPSLFSESDLTDWRKERAAAGRSLIHAERDCSRFRAAIARAGISSKVPLIKPPKN